MRRLRDCWHFHGTATISKHVQLNIIDEVIVGKTAGDGQTISVTNGGDTLTFNINLENPGASKTIKFKIENVGSVDAELASLSTTAPSDSAVSVNWPNLSNVVLSSGSTSQEYEIVVTWLSSVPNATSGNVTFSATINYAEYVAP